jgi:hypothetical protein
MTPNALCNRSQPRVKLVARGVQQRASSACTHVKLSHPPPPYLPLKWQQAAGCMVRDMSLPPDSTARAALAAGFCFCFAISADNSTHSLFHPPLQRNSSKVLETSLRPEKRMSWPQTRSSGVVVVVRISASLRRVADCCCRAEALLGSGSGNSECVRQVL